MSSPLTPLADGLLPAAFRTGQTRGRKHPEPEHPFRPPFQRDRDRIIHCAAFRRLEYKTQVFVNGEGDHYRTRLTHTLEVTQIARTIARALHLNEDLAEAAALSHDIGHTPFGHAGERVLRGILANEGGFNHNAHGLRVADVLEQRYAAFPGLNLSYETREGFVRHGHEEVVQNQTEFDVWDAPLLEIAVTIAADDIAYTAHDVDDGLYSGILDPAELRGLELWARATDDVPGFSALPPTLQRAEGVRRLVNILASDVIERSRVALEHRGVLSADEVRQKGADIIGFSPDVAHARDAMQDWLMDNFYRHPNVTAAMNKAEKSLHELFMHYAGAPEEMPPEFLAVAEREGVRRAVADYVAGMTDRYAEQQWEKIFLR